MKRTALVICFFLFAFRAGAQTSGTDTQPCADVQACVDAAQASAADAAAKQQAAMDTQNDAVATLDADVGKGACDAQVQDDQNVADAVIQDFADAQNAAQAAQVYASNAQTYADNDDLASAQQAAANAAAQDTQAQNSATKAETHNANVDDKIGDPENTIWNDNSTCTSPDNSTDDITNFNTTSPIPGTSLKELNTSFFPSTPTAVQGTPDDSGGGFGGGIGGAWESSGMNHEEDDDD